MLKCEEDFSLGRTAFKRIVSGIRRAGGHEYERLRAMGSDERPTGTTRQKGKRQNPMDKGPTGLVSGTVHQCKFCEKVCTSESNRNKPHQQCIAQTVPKTNPQFLQGSGIFAPSPDTTKGHVTSPHSSYQVRHTLKALRDPSPPAPPATLKTHIQPIVFNIVFYPHSTFSLFFSHR